MAFVFQLVFRAVRDESTCFHRRRSSLYGAIRPAIFAPVSPRSALYRDRGLLTSLAEYAIPRPRAMVGAVISENTPQGEKSTVTGLRRPPSSSSLRPHNAIGSAGFSPERARRRGEFYESTRDFNGRVVEDRRHWSPRSRKDGADVVGSARPFVSRAGDSLFGDRGIRFKSGGAQRVSSAPTTPTPLLRQRTRDTNNVQVRASLFLWPPAACAHSERARPQHKGQPG